jgi:arabinogalactan oligomer/maltooligosaccharide transport system substrate-binding protein
MNILKKIALGGSTVIAVTLLAACGSSSSSSSSSASNKVSGSVKLWVDTTQVSYYKTIAKKFNKEYPDVKVKVTQSPNGSANAKTDVGKDPSKAADVFEVPNDQLGSMADQGYINPLSPSATKTIKNDNTAASVKGVTWKNKLYGFPFAEQAQVLYYNKSKLSAEDVKSWETITAKGTVATDFTNAYVFYPIFFSAGTQLYGQNGETLKGTNVASQKGVDALTWIAQQKSNKGVMQTSNALNQLKSGNAAATIDGPWNTANIKKILGKNFAVAPYPSITVGGKTVQMKAFLGIEAFAVNSHTDTKNQKAAATLAQYITNKQSQLTVYKESGQVPVDKSAQKSTIITSDEAAKAVMTMAKSDNSVLMPKMSQMATFWNLAAPLINGSYTGSIKASDYSAKLASFQKSISQAN